MLSSYDKSRAAKLAELFTAQELDFITDALETTEAASWTADTVDIIWEAFNIAASRAYA
jgi:hypothetical protein